MKKAIPLNVCELTAVAAKDARLYAAQGVHIELHDDHYVAVATDGRTMVVVKGAYLEGAGSILETVEDDPEGGKATLIPSEVLKAIAKGKYRRVGSCQYDPLLVVIGKHTTKVARTDLERLTIEQSRNSDERFPDWRSVIPNMKKITPAKGRTCVNPKLLTQVLNTLAKLTDNLNVAIYTTQECGGFADKDKKDPLGGQLVITCKNDELQQEITAILMPLT